MTLQNVIEIWEMQHDGKGFFDDCIIPSGVDRNSLFDYLMLEYSQMRPIDGDSGTFHARVVSFFKIHQWNIEKLAKSLAFEYKPLDTYHGNQHISTVENIDTGITYHEDGDESSGVTHFISGFNDVRSPSGKEGYIDSEHDRDSGHRNYDKDGKHDTDRDRSETEDMNKSGNDGKTYQSLIEEERKQAQFNLYKWIARHFSLELLVAVW